MKFIAFITFCLAPAFVVAQEIKNKAPLGLRGQAGKGLQDRDLSESCNDYNTIGTNKAFSDNFNDSSSYKNGCNDLLIKFNNGQEDGLSLFAAFFQDSSNDETPYTWRATSSNKCGA